MNVNRLRAKLQRKEVITGSILRLPSPQLVEICGLVGFDFVYLDAEHSPINEHDCEEMVRAAEVRDIVPIARVPHNSPETILRFMDIGAGGVIVPFVNHAQEAVLAVKSVKYHPEGSRGLAATRSSDYGLGDSLKEYVHHANEETLVFGIIETQEGANNLEEIIAVDGIDGVIMGKYDLSQSLGVPGEGNHPLVEELMARSIGIARKIGKPIGTSVESGEDARECIERGMQILVVSAYGLFAGAAQDFIKAVRSER